MDKFNSKYRRENPAVSNQIDDLKKSLPTFKANSWTNLPYASYYVLNTCGNVEQYGVVNMRIIAHTTDYLSLDVVDFKLFRYHAEPIHISAARSPANIMVLLRTEELKTLEYNAVYYEDEIKSTISVYETVENTTNTISNKISGAHNLTLHINVDGIEIRRIRNYYHYGFVKNHPQYIWYSFPSNEIDKFKIYIVNIRSGKLWLFDEVVGPSNAQHTLWDKYLYIRQDLSNRLVPNLRHLKKKLPKNIYLYFSKTLSIDYDVLEYFVRSKYRVNEITNMCHEDPNKNYEVIVPTDDTSGLSFILYTLNNRNIDSVRLFDMYLREFFDYLLEHYEIEKFLIGNGEPTSSAYKTVERVLANTMCSTIPELVELLSKIYGLRDLLENNRKSHYVRHFIDNGLIDYSFVEEMYENKLNEVVTNGLLNVRWKSEYQLYLFVLHYHEDAIFQFRESWLIRQSLDIYIPSLRLGIEYQGFQHYEETDLFGGKSNLEKQKERDKTKALLCKANNVILIHWPYSKPVTIENVEKLFSSQDKKTGE